METSQTKGKQPQPQQAQHKPAARTCSCQATIPDGFLFCPMCGKPAVPGTQPHPLLHFCLYCGTQVKSATFRYCGQCASLLVGDLPPWQERVDQRVLRELENDLLITHTTHKVCCNDKRVMLELSLLYWRWASYFIRLMTAPELFDMLLTTSVGPLLACGKEGSYPSTDEPVMQNWLREKIIMLCLVVETITSEHRERRFLNHNRTFAPVMLDYCRLMYNYDEKALAALRFTYSFAQLEKHIHNTCVRLLADRLLLRGLIHFPFDDADADNLYLLTRTYAHYENTLCSQLAAYPEQSLMCYACEGTGYYSGSYRDERYYRRCEACQGGKITVELPAVPLLPPALIPAASPHEWGRGITSGARLALCKERARKKLMRESKGDTTWHPCQIIEV